MNASGVAGMAWSGLEWLGSARHGEAGKAWHVPEGRDTAGQAWRGGAGPVGVRLGAAWQAGYGTSGLGPSGLGWARLARLGLARNGSTRFGSAGAA